MENFQLYDITIIYITIACALMSFYILMQIDKSNQDAAVKSLRYYSKHLIWSLLIVFVYFMFRLSGFENEQKVFAAKVECIFAHIINLSYLGILYIQSLANYKYVELHTSKGKRHFRILQLTYCLFALCYEIIAVNYFSYEFYIGRPHFENLPTFILFFLPLGLVLFSLNNVKSSYKLFVQMHENSHLPYTKQVVLAFAIINLPVLLLPISVILNRPFFYFLETVIIFYYNLILHDKSVNLDFLTGLNNRTQLLRYLNRQFKKQNFLDESWHLYFFDIDYFKTINDTFGHESGDRALLAVAQALKLSAYSKDCFISRYAGDEFVVVAREEENSSFKNNFQMHLENLNQEEHIPFKLKVSIGDICYQEKYKSAQDFLKAADDSMYEQKKRNHLKL